jgi:hypothetical protein
MSPHVFAYLDLASGSMIVQAAIAGVVAAPILLRNHIRRFLHRGVSAEHETLEPSAPATVGPEAQPSFDGSESARP